MSREQAIELARKHAKAKPQSYYAEPFQPHEWVIDAICAALGLREAAPDMLSALEAQEEACAFADACSGAVTLDKATHDKADQLFGRAAVLRRAAIAKATAQKGVTNALALERDAARFRWLCDASGREYEDLRKAQVVGRLGECIDAAIASGPEGHPDLALYRAASEREAAFAVLAEPVTDPETQALLADWRRIVDGT